MNFTVRIGSVLWSSLKVDVVDAVWEALTLQTRNPEKYMAVTDVSVADDGTGKVNFVTFIHYHTDPRATTCPSGIMQRDRHITTRMAA